MIERARQMTGRAAQTTERADRTVPRAREATTERAPGNDQTRQCQRPVRVH
jgi:predicted phage gp36 major capsid-like protein